MDRTLTILCVVGARPNFMKIAPIMRALHAQPGLQPYLLHTGQHYDEAMKASFFQQLHIPEPDCDLEVGSGSHAQQTAEIMKRFEPVLDQVSPSAVLVVGDVNSTIACALVAIKKMVPVIHVEAGLRSGDRRMPEEINRILTDQLSALLFTTERSAAANLQREGIAAERIHFCGNVMIDTLRYNLQHAVAAERTLKPLGLQGKYGLLTLHRPANVDDDQVLSGLLNCLAGLSAQLPLVFPVHPRTRARIEHAGLMAVLEQANVHLLPPQGYTQMLGLMRQATMVLTDSGGIQEETTALGVPCLTLRDNTERPITLTEGTNTLVGTDPAAITAAFKAVLEQGGKAGQVPEYWDGQAAERIVTVLAHWLSGQEKAPWL